MPKKYAAGAMFRARHTRVWRFSNENGPVAHIACERVSCLCAKYVAGTVFRALSRGPDCEVRFDRQAWYKEHLGSQGPAVLGVQTRVITCPRSLKQTPQIPCKVVNNCTET